MPSVRVGSLKPYIFIAPVLIMFATFSVVPFVLLTLTSLAEWDGIFPGNIYDPVTFGKVFVGLHNYIEVVTGDPVFWRSFTQAGSITLLALTIQNAVALMLAIAVNRELKGRGIYRTIFFLPPILSEIVVGLVWFWIYDGNFGIFNELLRMLGLGTWTRAWLADPQTALTAVAVIHMWKGFGWGFVIFLAGLQTIPDELYEAARVDGASPWYRFQHITVPLLMPVIILVSILTILGTMQIFGLIISTTQGGPAYHTEVPITRIFASMLGSSRFGYACAQGIVFGLILLMLSLVQMRFQRRAA